MAPQGIVISLGDVHWINCLGYLVNKYYGNNIVCIQTFIGTRARKGSNKSHYVNFIFLTSMQFMSLERPKIRFTIYMKYLYFYF